MVQEILLMKKSKLRSEILKTYSKKRFLSFKFHCFCFRYHQIWKYHYHVCEVNDNDHDCPLGCKLIPCGYMILSTNKDIFNENSLKGVEKVK